jgi:glycosyltransferase involved in cell wall biosynthesis
MSKVTVIVPLFNRAGFIEVALRSLLAQREDCALDVLVVNDGSTDDGPGIIEALARENPEIRMVTTQNQGVTKARNVGLRHVRADCDFVTFLDSDDVSTRRRLASDLAEFVADPKLQMTYGQVTLVDHIDPDIAAPAAVANTALVRTIHVGAAIFRRAFVDRIGFFDEAMLQGEDTDFLLRAFESGEPFVLTDTNTLYYRQHPGNMTRDKAVVVQFLIRALRRSIVRRRANPQARIPAGLFDMKALRDVRFQG